VVTAMTAVTTLEILRAEEKFVRSGRLWQFSRNFSADYESRFKLFVMMALEFFIWGAWLPLIFGYLPASGLAGRAGGGS